MPPAVVLPKQQRQSQRLLDIATPLPAVEGNGNPQRWLEGVTWSPNDCSTLTPMAPDLCGPTDLFGVTTILGCDAWAVAQPFRVSQMFSGSVLNFPSAQDVADRLQDNYEAMISAMFADQLGIKMAAIATAPTQGQTFAGAAVPVSTAIGILESTIAARLRGRLGYIHIPPLLLGRALVTAGVYPDSGGTYRTACGNVVVSDAGYDATPGPGASGAPANLTDWIYCSGEVFYAKTTPDLLDPTLFDDRSGRPDTAGYERNRYEQYITGYGMLVLDACAVSAVKATVVG